MPTYTVICADKSTAQTHALLIAADSAELAIAAAATTGLMPGKALLAIPDAPTPYPPPPAELMTRMESNIASISRSAALRWPVSQVAIGVFLGFLTIVIAIIALNVFIIPGLADIRKADPTYNNRYGPAN